MTEEASAGVNGAVKTVHDGAQAGIAEQLLFADFVARQRSVFLVLWGSILGFMGFFFAAYLGLDEQGEPQYNINGQLFPSGNNYYTETVSEMVENPQTPEGKVFFGFVMTGSICILLSWYPWQLTNCYVGANVWALPGFKGLFLHLRSFLPPIGMMLVACIRFSPAESHPKAADSISRDLHTAGAVSAIGGFCCLEVLTLLLYTSKPGKRDDKELIFVNNERTVRLLLSLCTAISIACFLIAGALLHFIDFGRRDKWVVPSWENIAEAEKRGRLDIVQLDKRWMSRKQRALLDTAAGADLSLKKMKFWGEVLSGLFMIASHWVIWYYCPERHMHWDDCPTIEQDDEESLSDSSTTCAHSGLL